MNAPPAFERRTATAAAIACCLNSLLWAALGVATVLFAWFMVPIACLWLAAGLAVHDGSTRAAAFATVAGVVTAVLAACSLNSWRHLDSWREPRPALVAIQIAMLVLSVGTAVLTAPRGRPSFHRAWRAICGDL